MDSAQATTLAPLDDARPETPRVRARELLEAHGLLIFVFCAYLIEQVALLRRLITSDGWLTLVGGREIVQHGLPSTEHLTVVAAGRDWVDQQWLAQLVFYAVDRLGGIPLTLALSLALAAGSLLAGLLYAHRRGASSRTIAWVALVAFVPFGRSADVFRAQSLCYPLFVALLVLLCEADRRRSGRVYLVLPLLVLWANLHGSVAAAALIVSAYGLLGPWRRDRDRRRALALVVGPWACLLASPYALDLPHYYRSVLVNPAFSSYVTEWKPATLSALNLPLFCLVGGVAVLFGRRPAAWGPAERAVLAVCAVLALLALRNGVWLALACAALAPSALGGAGSRTELEPARRRMNALLALGSLTALVWAAAATAGRSSAWFTSGYPDAAAAAAARAAGATGSVFATEDFADWLLWRRPELRGRVAYDDRLELLRARELQTVFELKNGYLSPSALGRQYAVFVGDPAFARTLRARLGARAHALYTSRSVVVLDLRRR